MTQVLLDPVTVRESESAGSAPPRALRTGQSRAGARTPVRPARSRPGRGSGRAARPALRPTQICPAPGLASGPKSRSRACVMPEPSQVAPVLVAGAVQTWRLTDRGVAVVLVIGLMIMVAAATVVGLTAVRVTGDGYQATVSASLPR